MAVLKNYIVLIVCILTIERCSSSSIVCKPKTNSFMHDLKLQCPKTISFSSLAIEMDGESLERALGSSRMNTNTAVLFYASWCPFSSVVQSQFSSLSFMFPQIKHVMVEESSTLPSVFSRYGIRSLPSILMVNQNGIVRYHGLKDLPSFIRFYKSTTGFDPVVDVTEVQESHGEIGHRILQPWHKKSLKEIFAKDPYLVLSVVFLLFKAFMYFFPQVAFRVRELWVAYAPHLSMGVFGESNQLLRRAFHVIDLKRVGDKVNMGTGSFHRGARVWASSLASVSLGETSMARVSPTGDL